MNSQEGTPYTVAVRGLLIRWAVVLSVLIVILLWAAWRLSNAGGSPVTVTPPVEYWTCSMHPEVRESGPGKCPICGMELIPHRAEARAPSASAPRDLAVPNKQWYRCTMPECGDQGSADPTSRCPVCGMKREPVGEHEADGTGTYEIRLSERARRLAGLATEPARLRRLVREIRTVGKIGYDETRHRMVAAWIGGRIDRLFADFSGMLVQEGDHLVELYSPELLSAQEEYLQAIRSARAMQDSALDASRASAEQLARSARRKLELLGITDKQIEAIEASGTPQTHLVVHAPIGGTVVRKNVMEGQYVRTGDVLYEIADLTHVWLLLDVYEADVPWIRPFQTVRVTAEALPGEMFDGHIAFVDPVVDDRTRTIKVRVNVANPERRLKPAMFVTAHVSVAMDARAAAAGPALEGRYACPMHPWETAQEPATCPICEMDMVEIEAVPGYVPPSDPAALLAVPREAVMQTGERTLVYIETGPGVYRGVEVRIGPLGRDGTGRDYYPVLSGLTAGQTVVTRGGFVIDSQMQLAGKPSLFHARGLEGGGADAHAGHASGRTADVQDQPATEPADAGVQTICPVMGNPIQDDVFIDYHGVRVFFCCWGCDKRFQADPEKYIVKLPDAVQAQIRAAVAATQEAGRD